MDTRRLLREVRCRGRTQEESIERRADVLVRRNRLEKTWRRGAGLQRRQDIRARRRTRIVVEGFDVAIVVTIVEIDPVKLCVQARIIEIKHGDTDRETRGAHPVLDG